MRNKRNQNKRKPVLKELTDMFENMCSNISLVYPIAKGAKRRRVVNSTPREEGQVRVH